MTLRNVLCNIKKAPAQAGGWRRVFHMENSLTILLVVAKVIRC